MNTLNSIRHGLYRVTKQVINVFFCTVVYGEAFANDRTRPCKSYHRRCIFSHCYLYETVYESKPGWYWYKQYRPYWRCDFPGTKRGKQPVAFVLIPQTLKYANTNDATTAASSPIAIGKKRSNNTSSNNINTNRSTSSTDNGISRVPKGVSNRLLLYWCREQWDTPILMIPSSLPLILLLFAETV